MQCSAGTHIQRSYPPRDARLAATSSRLSIEHLDELSKLRAPRELSVPESPPSSPPPDDLIPQQPAPWRGTLALLNAKIGAGHAATLAVLGTMAHHGLSAMVNNASSFLISGITLFTALSLARRMSSKDTPNEESGMTAPCAATHPATIRVSKIVNALCQQHGIPEPHVLVMGHSTPNAAMLDRWRAKDTLIVTNGVAQLLDDRELRAVVAHEVAHQDRWYTRLRFMNHVVAALVRPFVTWGTAAACFSALAPTMGSILAAPIALGAGVIAVMGASIALNLCTHYVSRHNEIKTDLRSCKMTGDPEALISALRKLEQVTPHLRKTREVLESLGLCTHPSWEERAMHIRKMFGEPQVPSPSRAC